MSWPGLVERNGALASLDGFVTACRDGQGAVVELVGEAGVGKSALVEAFRDLVSDAFPVHIGGCADLRSPVPLAPLGAVARDVPALADALGERRPSPIIAEALIQDLLRSPAAIVLEDVHWADEATVDVLAEVIRRADDLHGLLVLTYRPLVLDDPLRSVVGRPGSSRIVVEPLTIDGVAEIAGPERAAELHELTGGNPYFVAELAAADAVSGSDLPASVSDAILRQIAALGGEERELLELVACTPAGATSELLDAALPDWARVVDRPEQTGIVTFTDALRFRHELGRRAVFDSLGGARVRHLHLRIAEALEQTGAAASELVHYAVAGDDIGRIIDYGPAAAKELSDAGAHRAAAKLLSTVLEHRRRLDDAATGACFESLSYEHWALAEGRSADRAAEQAALAFAAAGDVVGEAKALRSRANYALGLGRLEEGFHLRERAIALLEPLGPSPDLISVLSDESNTRCSAAQWDLAESAGQRALEMAEELDETQALVQAIYGYGYFLAYTTGDEATMRRGVTFGGDTTVEHTAVGLANLSFALVERSDLSAASSVAAEAREFAERHDLRYVLQFVTVIEGRIDLEAGRWTQAERGLRGLEPEVAGSGLEVELPLAIWLGFLAVRQGWSDAEQRLALAVDLGSEGVELVHRVPLVLLQCEHAWLRDEIGEAERELLQPFRPFFDRPGLPWAGALAYWMTAAGGTFDTDGDLGSDAPGHVLARGDWAEAAEAWGSVDHPYERAMALSLGDDVGALTEAIEVFDNLGAPPIADKTRARLREIDPSAVPNRPKQTRSSDPTKLSRRQLDVLALLSEHLTNAEIAERLFVSVRTVDHHVSAVLTKMGVANRREAAIEAGRRGLLDGQEGAAQ